METMRDRTNRQSRTECLMAGIRLAFVEFCLAQSSFKVGEQMTNGLCVIPDMCTGAGATTAAVGAALPAPKSAVGLSENRRRLQYSQIRSDGLNHFRWKRGIIESLSKHGTFSAQIIVVITPVIGNFCNTVKLACIPWNVMCRYFTCTAGTALFCDRRAFDFPIAVTARFEIV